MGSDPQFQVFRTDRPGIRKVLGDLEAEIMELIWARPTDQGTTVRDIFEILYGRRRIAYTTVMSTMTRLAKKRLLRAEKSEHAYVYYPTLTEEEFVARFVDHLLEDLLVNFSGVALQRLATQPNTETTERAQRLLDQIARRRVAEETSERVEKDEAQ